MSKENNKEHELMEEELKRFREGFQLLLEHSRERDIKVDEMVTRVNEMYKVFTNGSFVVSIIKWFFGVTIALGGLYLMIKEIFYDQN